MKKWANPRITDEKVAANFTTREREGEGTTKGGKVSKKSGIIGISGILG